ncbi:MAG: pyridoxal phosphate-dependent aminotransferase [Asticcacaulis sp.]|uniref:pyridoxal phosphate-dependent aminotransferase n=1 Tax=Asticcacaulis sp. TaxID=1872648 RepID=UPI0039E67671
MTTPLQPLPLPASTSVRRSTASLSYAQWVRHAISQSSNAFVLFDSSVDEPKTLLQETIIKVFGNTVSDRYTSAFVNGNPFALKALSRRYQIPEEYILTTSAATTAISLVYRAYLKPGDHILVETPRFDLLETTAEGMDVDVEDFQRTAPNYKIDIEGLRRQIRSNTRLIVLSDLHNPSGALLSEGELQALTGIASEFGLKIVVDEVYGDYAERARPRSAAEASPDVIAINSLTKIYGLSTLRFGWVFASPETLAPIRDTAARYDFTSSNLTHAIASLVLEDDQRFDAYRQDVMNRTRPIMERAFTNLANQGLIEGSMPSYGCICFPKLVGIADTNAFSDWLAVNHNVRVAPGEYFGAPGFVRIGFAKEPFGMTAALERFTIGLHQYQTAPTRAIPA